MNDQLTHRLNRPGFSRGLVLANLLAAVALILALYAVLHRTGDGIWGTASSSEANAMTRIRNEGVLRVGYGIWPPFSIVDEAEPDPTKKLKGFSVDLVNEIARRHSPPLRVEWHRMNWDTMRADLSTGRFDFVCESVFQTIPRAADFGLSEPYAAFGLAAAVVRIDETRFQKFEDLDRPEITIALAEGWTTSEFARARLTKPKFLSVTVREDVSTQMSNVMAGRADVALNDVPSVVNFVRAHSDQVKALWIDPAPTMVVGGFVTRPEEKDLLAFLNSCLRVLKADGTIKQLDERWKTTGYYQEEHFVPGAGLRR